MKKYLLSGGKLVFPDKVSQGDVLVEGGTIAEIFTGKSDAKRKIEDCEVIDCSKYHIFPGFIDTHVHFREPGYEQTEDFASGSLCAIRSGITTIFDMPNNSPAITTVATLEMKQKLARQKMLVNYAFYLGATAENIDEITNAKNIP